MNIIADETKKKEILQLIRERSWSDRTGLHFSDLNYCLRKPYYREKYPDIAMEQEKEDTTLIFSLGHAWEYWLTRTDEHHEYKQDGITCTPDFSYREGEIWEIKATYLSARKDIREQTTWLRQCMAYCKVTGVTTFYIVPLHVMGTWDGIWKKKGENLDRRRPLMNVWRCEFTQEEIDVNWELGLHKKKLLEEAIATSNPMGNPMQEKWECGFCLWQKKGICEIGASVVDKKKR